MVVNIYIMVKVVIKIVQGSAVTQTVLGGLTIYLLVVNFLQCRPLYVPNIMEIIGWQETELLQK